MAILINTNQPSILNGVSQQAEALRRQSQLEEQINAISSLIDTLGTRPPSNHEMELFDKSSDGVSLSSIYTFPVNRDETEQHLITINTKSDSVSLAGFDLLTNTRVTFKNADGLSLSASDLAYLRTDAPKKDLRVLTIEDYTFVLNRSVKVSLSGDTSPVSDNRALVFVKLTAEDVVFTVKLWNSESGSGSPDYTANFTASASDKQSNIVTGLINALNADGANSVYTYSGNSQDLIEITKTDESNYRIEVECSNSEYLFAYKETAKTLSTLPDNGYAGFKTRITSDPDSTDNEYWVEYKSNNSSVTSGFTNGFWEETIAPNIKTTINGDTMPHAIISEGSNVFTFKPLEWGDRLSGDENTNKDPDFIGDNINGMFLHENRLGLFSKENIALSQTGQFFNFFKESVITVLDTDPILTKATVGGITNIQWAVENSERLILFSDRNQFKLSSGSQPLTIETIKLKQTSAVENLRDVEPLTMGNSILFGFPMRSFSGVKQFYPADNNTELFNDLDTTEHVPNYISGRIERLAKIDSENILVATSSGYRNGMYIYKFFESGGERLLSSWSKLSLCDNEECIVYDVFTIGTLLYVIVERDDKVFLESIDLQSGYKDSNSETFVALSRRVTDEDCTISYSPITDLTTIELPYYANPDHNWAIVTRTTDSFDGGIRLVNVTAEDGVLHVLGDHSSKPLWIGIINTEELTLSSPVATEQAGESRVPLFGGVFQLTRLTIEFSKSITFKVRVEPTFGVPQEYNMTNFYLGSGDSIIDQSIRPRNGSIQIPIQQREKNFKVKIINDTPFPCFIVGVNWEGLYYTRSRRT